MRPGSRTTSSSTGTSTIPSSDELKLLAWSDSELEGKGYIDWYPVDHPQLGRVELGGWDRLYCWTNPPPHLLEAEIEKHSEFAVFHALISPKLEIHSVEHEDMGSGKHYVRLVVSTPDGCRRTCRRRPSNERRFVRFRSS